MSRDRYEFFLGHLLFFVFSSLFGGFRPSCQNFFLQIFQEWKLVAPVSPTEKSLTCPFMYWGKRSKPLKAPHFDYITR